MTERGDAATRTDVDGAGEANDPAAVGRGEYDVPPDAETYDCEYCGRPFARESWRRLHLGLAHPAQLDDSEVDAFRAAYEDEASDLRAFRLKALGLLLILYFGLLMVYAVV